MESLSYIFWVFCLVQIVNVNGKPDFATSFQFSATTSISRLSKDVSTLFTSMDDKLRVMLSNSIPDSESQRQLLLIFAENFGLNASAVTDQLEASANSTSSMGTTLDMVLTTYRQLVVYFNSNANNFLLDTKREIGKYVTKEFFNGLVRLITSGPALRAAIETLQASLQNASTAADVPSDALRTLVRALRLLKAHLPLLVYTFQRIGDNIRTADIYMDHFNQDFQALSGDFMQEAATFNTKLSAFDTDVEMVFSSVKEMFDNAGTQLDTELTGDVESQTSFMQLQTELKYFTSNRSMYLQNMFNAIQSQSTYFQGLAEQLVNNEFYLDDTYTLDSLALELAMQLITSGVFDRLCYNKYAALVADLPTIGRIRLRECFQRELPRLKKFQKLIQTYTLMVSYDVEDFWLNLKPCRSAYASSECLSVLAAFYPRLFAVRLTTTNNFFTFAINNAAFRVLGCAIRTNFITFDYLVPSLEQSIRNCPNVV